MKRVLLVGSMLSVLAIAASTAMAFEGGCGCGVAAGPACGDACDPCGDPCGDPCAAPCRPCCGGPIAWVVKLLRWGCCCDGGCGERYWGQCSEPVDCCDPCDTCGNWVGHSGPVGRPNGGYAHGYARSAPRGPTYANHDGVKNEFGLDPSVKVVSRSDQVVVPAQASAPVANYSSRPYASQAARPQRAPSRR